MPRGLYPRSILIAIVPVVLLLAAASYVFYDLHWRQTSRKLSQGVASDIAYILALRADGRLPNAAISDLAEQHHRLQVDFQPGAELPTVQRKSIFSALDDTLSQELQASLDAPYWYDISGYGDTVEIRVAAEGGVVAFTALRDRTFSTTGHMFIFWVLGVTLILVMLAIGFLRNQVRSILRLAEAVKAFGRGRDAPDFRPSGAREVRETARAVLDMKDRLTAAAEQRTAMLAGVSHDLRTPLTRLKLQLAMMGDGEDVQAARRDLDDMSAMLDEYLAFARGDELEPVTNLDVSELLQDISTREARSGLTVVADGPASIPGRPLALRRAVTNLIQNALAYGDEVRAEVVNGPRAVDVIVDDDGPGIPENQREEAFKPFTRLDKSRSQNRSGAGLGLALSRDTARRHGGDLTLEASPLGGLRARLRLPH